MEVSIVQYPPYPPSPPQNVRFTTIITLLHSRCCPVDPLTPHRFSIYVRRIPTESVRKFQSNSVISYFISEVLIQLLYLLRTELKTVVTLQPHFCHLSLRKPQKIFFCRNEAQYKSPSLVSKMSGPDLEPPPRPSIQ